MADWNEVKCPHCKKSMRFDATICPYCRTPATLEELASRKSEHKANLVGCGVIAVVALLVLGYCSSGGSDKPAPVSTSATAPLAKVDTAAPSVAENKLAGPVLTPPQLNALRSAEQYLAMQGFSRAGLIEQLSSSAGDGYAKADAIAAVDSLDVDWNENAAKSAAQYLEMMGFSCNGLIEQLSSDAGDGYTKEQAKFGAKSAGAC